MNHKFRQLNQKRRRPYKHKINHLPKSYFHTTKINIKILRNCKQIKYQPTREEKPVKYKTTNNSQPEPAQVGNPNPKSKTK
jgi:hypothetical protein